MSSQPAIRQAPGMRQADIRRLRRSSLLRAALETVAHHDIEGATVARICARAGASRGLITHYFDSKEDLLLCALRGLFDDAQALKDSIAADSSQAPARRIEAIARSSFEPPVYAWEMAAAWRKLGLPINCRILHRHLGSFNVVTDCSIRRWCLVVDWCHSNQLAWANGRVSQAGHGLSHHGRN